MAVKRKYNNRVLLFSDSHIHVGDDLRRFAQLNKYIRAKDICHVVCVGDFLSLDSCSTHETPGSYGDKTKPVLLDEIELGHRASEMLTKKCGSTMFQMIGGNHEDRLQRFVDRHPNELCAGVFSLKDQLGYTNQYGWSSYTPFRSFSTVLVGDKGETAATHIPHNVMGRPIGGVNAARMVGTHLGRDMIFGHTHQFNVCTIPLFDGDKRTVISMPCFMQLGYTPKYAQNCSTGWSNGFIEIGDNGGKIDSVRYVSLTDLDTDNVQ